MILVFEGIDGSGKQTQIDLFLESIKAKGKTCAVFKFPTAAARKAHRHLMGAEHAHQSELFDDFSQDIQSSTDEINEAAEKYDYVILDRYIYSTIAYQGGELGFENAILRSKKLNLVKPDLVILLKIDAQIAMLRKSRQKILDKFEGDLDFQKSVALRYNKLAASGFFSRKWLVVDAASEPAKVQRIIIKETMV